MMPLIDFLVLFGAIFALARGFLDLIHAAVIFRRKRAK
jgi:hypothetical protein